MPLPTFYNTGLATVANGSPTVTGAAAGWKGRIYAGDLFYDPAQPTIRPVRIAADPTGDTLTLAENWGGTALTGDTYEILITPDSVRMQERTRQVLEQMSVVEANGRGLFYLFATATADADPGAGYLRFNNATIGSATAAYLDNADANGSTVSAVLDTWDDNGATGGRGQLWVRSVATPSTFYAFNVTGSVVDGTGYRKLTLSYIGGSGTLLADDELMLDFVAAGPAGAAGSNGSNGINGVDGKFSGTEVIKTVAATLGAADVGKTIILNKATADTLSFDAAATLGSTWMVMVKNVGAGTWVLDPNGVETIDGATTASLAQGESVVVSSNGTALRIYFRGSAAFTQFTAASSAGPARLDLAEDTDNGTNKISVVGQAALSADRTFTLPDATGTAIVGGLGATDNRVVRSDGTGGQTAQNSPVTIDDSGNMSGVGTLGISGLLTSNGQVKFPGTANPSSDVNTLDEYEEGTFTPAFSATGCTFSYSAQVGRYIKIGKLVWVNIVLALNTSGNTLAANPLSITGLPFTSGAAANHYGRVNWLASTSNYVDMMGIVDSSSTAITIRGLTAAGTGNLSAINASAALHATNGSIITATWVYEATA